MQTLMMFKFTFFSIIIGNPPWKTKHSKEKQLFEDYIVKRRLKESSNLTN